MHCWCWPYASAAASWRRSARAGRRNGERERIARDLHDTLLQGSQGLILRLHAISQSAQTPEPVRSQQSAMQLAERNLAEVASG